MRKPKLSLLVSAALCFTVGSLFAHHAVWATYANTKMLKRKGVITRFALVNPHSLVFVDSVDPSGQVEHWALETPNVAGLATKNLGKDVFKPGDTVEFCGYATKDGVPATKSYQDPEPISLSLKNIPRPVVTGRLIYPELLVLASGQRVQWATDERKCLN